MAIGFSSFATAANGQGRVGPIDFHLPSGSALGIYGPSGVGKTTLLRALADGTKSPNITSGEVKMSGRAAYVPQNRVLQGGLLLSRFLFTIAKVDRCDELLRKLSLTSAADRKLEELSGGEAQRSLFAAAALSNPRHLLLDEPFSALDYGLKIAVAKLLTHVLEDFEIEIENVVLASHDVDALIVCADYLLILKKSVDGSTHALISNPIDRKERLDAIDNGRVAEVRTKIPGRSAELGIERRAG